MQEHEVRAHARHDVFLLDVHVADRDEVLDHRFDERVGLRVSFRTVNMNYICVI